MATNDQLVSIVVPVYNEAAGLEHFHTALTEQLASLPDYHFEIIYCNDGSTDRTLHHLQRLAADNKAVRVISLTRNFGKEIATTAGLQAARGQAVVTMDADGQQPIDMLPTFIAHWQAGDLVVVGRRTTKRQAPWLKRLGSKLFHVIMQRLTYVNVVPGATDFRLVDRQVVDDFNQLTERNRISRGLIDWLGYQQTYVSYQEKPRVNGTASYSYPKLTKLFVDSIISMSSSPLYLTAYLGALVLPLSLLLGLAMVADAAVGDPLNWHATGGAYVLVLVLFLIGVLLTSQGIIGLYLSHIHSETQNRPLFVVDRKQSRGYDA